MSEVWEPDIIIDSESELYWLLIPYLDGVRQDWCLEARVKWESFVQPTFGELIVASLRGGQIAPTVMDKPRLGEIEMHRCWAKFVVGKVFLQAKPGGEARVAELIEICKQQEGAF